jgi:hypothetical protein
MGLLDIVEDVAPQLFVRKVGACRWMTRKVGAILIRHKLFKQSVYHNYVAICKKVRCHSDLLKVITLHCSAWQR